MALQKEFEINNTGISANYIRIESVTVVQGDPTSTINISCGLYSSKEARDLGKNPISSITLAIANQASVDALLDISYEELKRQVDLQGAIDV